MENTLNKELLEEIRKSLLRIEECLGEIRAQVSKFEGYEDPTFDLESDLEPDEPVSAPQPDPVEAGSSIEPEAEPEQEVETEIEAVTEPGQEVEQEPEAVTEPEQEVETEIEAVTEPGQEVEQEPEAVTEPEQEVKMEPEPMPEPESEPAPPGEESFAWKTDLPGSSVRNILSAISLNDRLLFINTLFDKDPVKFQSVITELNSLSSFAEGEAYVLENFENWKMSSEVVYRFMMAVRRKLK